MKKIILCNNLKGPVDYLKLHKYLSFKKVYWIFYSFLMLSNNYHYNFLVFPFGWSFFAQFLILFLDTSPSWLWYMLSYNVKKTYLEIMVLSNVFILMSNLIFKRTNSIPGHKWVFLIFFTHISTVAFCLNSHMKMKIILCSSQYGKIWNLLMHLFYDY